MGRCVLPRLPGPGERVIHARGLAFAGRASFPGAAALGLPLLAGRDDFPVRVRLSRGAGLPPNLPDFLGFAVRVCDAGGPGLHQDLLLDTGASPVVLRNLPLPRRDVLGATYSSLVRFEVGGHRLLLGAWCEESHPLRSLEELEDLLPLRFSLLVAGLTGPWEPLGTVVLEGVLPPPGGRRLRFSPSRDGAGIVPVGRLNAWRRGAYEASHVGPDA